MYTTSDLIKAHSALHDPIKDYAIISGDRPLLISIAGNGCRMVDFFGLGTLMEQNKEKSSRFAKRARNGEKLSWFIPTQDNNWILITDKGIEQ